MNRIKKICSKCEENEVKAGKGYQALIVNDYRLMGYDCWCGRGCGKSKIKVIKCMIAEQAINYIKNGEKELDK